MVSTLFPWFVPKVGHDVAGRSNVSHGFRGLVELFGCRTAAHAKRLASVEARELRFSFADGSEGLADCAPASVVVKSGLVGSHRAFGITCFSTVQ